MFKLLFSLIRSVFVVVLIGGGAWVGYNYYLADDTPAPPALPELPGYKVVEGQTITGYINTLGEGATQLTDQPELAQLANSVDQAIQCYQDIGAVQARIYSHEETPLSSGAVAIADRNALLNPVNLFNCVAPQESLGITTQGVKLEPCTTKYTVSRDDNEYYIIYAGTTAEICQAFCDQLEGCIEHQ